MILKSSPRRNRVAEQPIDFNSEKGRSSKVFVEEEEVKDKEDDDLIFRKIDIPWLSNKTSTL